MALVLEDEITLSTRLGTSQVQLWLGDITKLPVKDKVDILLSSAFPGDYGTGNPRSLFYSLKKNLGIVTKNLAKQKDLDLRKNFSCWMSARLPDDKPYRRLVCFEIDHRGQAINEQISMVFRAMMPIFNGSESTVMTPILATGCQNAPLVSMLSVMVNAACQWIKAGLPLKCLKLVLYTGDPESSRKIQYKDAISYFGNLKKIWMGKESKVDNAVQYEFCFCCAEQDQHWVERISETLKSLDRRVRIHSAIFKKNEEDCWQDEIYTVMANSVRILVILTPTFVSDIFCLEQFNMAMCCNRMKKETVVIPFYVETVTSFPSYLNLVQYTECRVRKDNETWEEKISTACSDLINNIRRPKVDVADQEENPKLITISYDVFVSYSHRNSDIAKTLVDTLEKNYPDLKVFFDRSELKSGNIWQQSLYEAVDKSRCMVALLSDTYMKSTVCREEFYIAAGRHMAKENFLLLSVCLPELTHLPSSFNCCQVVEMTNQDPQKEMDELMDKLIPVVMELKKVKKRKQSMKLSVVKNILARQRVAAVVENFHITEDKEMEKKVSTDTSNVEGTVTFSYNHDGLKFAAILSELIKMYAPKVATKLLSKGIMEANKEIDSSDMVVIFASDEYMESQHHVEELHMALCKQRNVKESTCVYLVETDHVFPKPFYPHVLPFQLNFRDTIWQRWGKRLDTKDSRFIVRTDGMQGTYMCSKAQHMALKKAMYDVLDLLSQRNQGSTLPTNIVNVVKAEMELRNIPDNLVNVKEVAVPLSDLTLLLNTNSTYSPQQNEEKVENEEEDEENEVAGAEMPEEHSQLQHQAETFTKTTDKTGGQAVIEELNQLTKSGKPVLKDRFRFRDLEHDVVNPGVDKTLMTSEDSKSNVAEKSSIDNNDRTVMSRLSKESLNSWFSNTVKILKKESVMPRDSNLSASSVDTAIMMEDSNPGSAQTAAGSVTGKYFDKIKESKEMERKLSETRNGRDRKGSKACVIQ